MSSTKSEMISTRDKYIEMVKKELLGPGSEISIPDEEHELITNSPEKNYSIGILFPRDNKINADSDDPDRVEESDPDNDDSFDESEKGDIIEDEQIATNNVSGNITAGEEDNLDEEIGLAAQNMPSSIGITFFVEGKIDDIKCSVSFATYRKAVVTDCRMPIYPDNPGIYEVPESVSGWFYYDKEEGTIRLQHDNLKRKIVSELSNSIDEDSYNLIDRMYKISNQLNRGWVREPHNQLIDIVFGDNDYVDSNKDIDGTSAKVTALRRVVGENLYSLTIMLVNDSDKQAKGDTCLFQPEITVSSENNTFNFRTYSSISKLNNLDDEEKSLELQYRHKKVYATGLGTSAYWEINDAGEGYIKNDYFPEVEVPSMDFNMPEESEVDRKTFSMKYLSDFDESEKSEKIANLKSVINEYDSWIKGLENKVSELDKEFKPVALKNIEACKDSCKRMYAGLSTLQDNETAWNAFQLANRAMYMQRIHIVLQVKTSQKDRYDGDKELEELLENIRRDYKKADEIDILSEDPYSWRPFQLAFLVMSVDSIVDEKSDDRALVDLIWFPTGGGKTEAYLGLTAFTIFFRRMTYPESCGGTTVMMRYTLRLLAAQQFTRASTLICACELIRQDCENGRSQYKRYELGDEPITIGLWIGSEHTPNKNSEAKKELDELLKAGPGFLKIAKDKHNKFQVLKCPWCGTKMVKDPLPGLKKTIGAFGYRMDKGKHFQLRCTNEACDYNRLLPIQVIDEELYRNPPTLLFGTVDKFAMMPWNDSIRAFFGIGTENRAPELVIQDELHLISGPLGTIVGLYETAIDTLCEIKGNKCKIVASTATIRKAKEQCSALYNREVAQFPSPGLDADDSFFAKESEINYENGVFGRKYIGLMPSGKTKAMMEVRSIAALMQVISTQSFEGISDFCKDKFWTLTAYFNSLKDLGKCSTLISDDVISHIRMMASRLGNPNSGRRVFGVDELTSRISTTELNETLDKLEKKMYSSDDQYRNKGVSSVLIATNMISVGIDIARLNVMLMVGQPKLTSEYIQASSRVGRSYPGVVFAMYDGSKSRDRSHYEQFKSYHESFYKYVEPTGATPFSKPARERALHAVAIALMRYMVPELRDELSAGTFKKEKYEKEINFIANVLTDRSKDIASRLNSHMIDDSEEIRQEVLNVFDTWDARAEEFKDIPFAYGNKYMVKGPGEAEGRLMKVFNTSPKDNKPFDTMTSMRNVDSSVAANIIVWE